MWVNLLVFLCGGVLLPQAGAECHYLPGCSCTASEDLVYVRNVTSAAECCTACDGHEDCTISQWIPPTTPDKECASCCILKKSCVSVQNGTDPRARVLCSREAIGPPTPVPPPPPPPGPKPRVAPAPSLLICCPDGPFPYPVGWVTMDWMREIQRGGIAVDFTNGLADCNRTRVFNYTAVLVFDSQASMTSPPPTASSWPSMLGEYVAAGGGLFLYPSESNWKRQELSDVATVFDLRMPLELLNETNASNTATMERFVAPLAYSDNIVANHPVTKGVGGIWFPTNRHYNGGETAPLCLTPVGPDCEQQSNWTTLVRASATTVTAPMDLHHSTFEPLPPGVFQRQKPVSSPPLLAVREYGLGRVAAMAQWRQYTIGSGDKWLFANQVLSAGANGIRSDMGVLLSNLASWISKPVAAGGPGGYTAKPLVYPNDDAATRAQFNPKDFQYKPSTLSNDPFPALGLTTTKGLIGLRSAYSTGTGTVAEFAAAASEAGLGFLVFAEDWSTMPGKRTLTDATLASLKADCKAHSTKDLMLIPGYTIENNIGNKVLIVGYGAHAPPADALTNDTSQLLMQGVDVLPPHNYTGYNTPAFNWLLGADNTCKVGDTTGCLDGWTVGYYHLGPTRTHGSMSMPDLRCFSMAGALYYGRDGELVENLRDDFLFTIESTIAPVPTAVSEVTSPTAVISASKSQALTHVTGTGPTNVFVEGLRWNSQYDALRTYVSNGPCIDAWPATNRAYSLGAERFATGNALLQAPLSISSPSGKAIVEVNITNGRRLFRRFVGEGPSLHRTLLLDGYVHANYGITVTDSDGKFAFGTPLRTWKPGQRSIVFCGDHVNDCESDGMQLGHGPVATIAAWVPRIPDDIAGGTWDGGPGGYIPLLTFQESQPQILASALGVELGQRFTQTPHLESSDEGGTAVTSINGRIFADNVERVVNAWHTFGPIAGPSRLFNYTTRFRLWFQATAGVPNVAYPGDPLSTGNVVTMFRNELTFKQSNTITKLALIMAGANSLNEINVLYVVVAASPSASPVVVNVSDVSASMNFTVKAGGWWALYSPEPSNSQLFTNRQATVVLTIQQCGGKHVCAGDWLSLYAPSPLKVQPGDTLVLEYAQVALSLERQCNTTADVKALQQYHANPPGLIISAGHRLSTPSAAGIIEVTLDETGVGRLRVPQADDPNALLPLRFTALNQRWTVGFAQHSGYSLGHYTAAESERWTALGLSFDGNAHVPLYTGLGAVNCSFGHPVTASNPELFVQVTRVDTTSHSSSMAISGPVWHIAVNNPTNTAMTVSLKKAMDLNNLSVPTGSIAVPAGGWFVVS